MYLSPARFLRIFPGGPFPDGEFNPSAERLLRGEEEVRAARGAADVEDGRGIHPDGFGRHLRENNQ